MINGEKKTVAMVCDVMTSSSHRGKGIFTKLGKYSTDEMNKERIAFTAGYPIRPEVMPGHMKVGWDKYFTMPIYVKPLKANSVLKSKNLNFLSPIANLGINCINLFVKLISPSVKNYELEFYDDSQIDKIKGYEDFLNKWNKNFDYYLVKDKEFLKWRTNAPGTNYTFIIARQNNEIKGLVLARKTILDNIPSLALLDMMILPQERKKTSFALNKGIVKIAKEKNAELIASMISPFWAKEFKLKSLLYVKSKHVFTLIIKWLNLSLKNEDITDEKWHQMWINSDDL